MRARKALLVFNPNAGHGKAAELLTKLRQVLGSGGFLLDDAPTRGPAHATEIAALARERGDHDVLFALGGDGTHREVAAGLIGGDLPLAMLPAGTANVLPLALDLPQDPLAAARLLIGPTRRRDMTVGLCNGDPFLMMASCGIDAEVLARTRSEDKKRWGQAAVLKNAFAGWLRYSFPPMQVTTGGITHESSFVVAANIPWYGGPFEMAPTADPFDDSLELVEWHGSDRRAFLTFLLDVGLAAHPRREDVSFRSVDSMVIESADRFCYQLDGDAFWAEKPLQIGISPQRVPVLVPNFD